MAIQLNCKCGRYFELDDGSAGRTIQCPSCDVMMAVPSRSDPQAHAPDQYSDVQSKASGSGQKWGSPQSRDDDDYDYNGEGERRERRRDIDRRFVKGEPKPSGGFMTVNAGVGGGLAMMAIGVVVFLGLFAVGFISVWPIIIFVIGLIAFFKGLANSSR